ncbi:MAG: class I SAM-dependent methyltransferase [Bacteroidetes bacterium]|nr:class I SAM-dependent methyltransferase [Rhodothermia bacterium]MCX7907225.1 class I SAM-dependent methyltransferase [Bacteroidota bacterium]MDW8286099.1 class I SAM-dependent methyltransferase [Bacteroidota bacterium]
MDILNYLPPKRFAEYDDFLTFISIYDDRRREWAYKRLLRRHRDRIRGAVCLEAGCGLGIFSAYLARLGARRVYAVESNPLLYGLARERLRTFPQVRVLRADLRDFEAPEPIDVLVHDLYGQLLYDEDLHVLSQLPIRPRLVLPNGGRLLVGTVRAALIADRTVSLDVLSRLDGLLVSGLFAERGLRPQRQLCRWRFGETLSYIHGNLEGLEGEVVFFAMEVLHDELPICRAGECPNWSYVWTWRRADRFWLRFEPDKRGMRVRFGWEDP